MTIDFNQFNQTTYPYLDDSNIDDYIPVAYGKVSAAKLVCINSNYDTDNGDVSAVYRMPDGTSNYGTAYVYIDDTWIAATVASVDYNTELITISNGRSGSGSTYECKIVDFYGYMFDGHSYARQILQHWCAKYGNIQYTDSNFDKTNWEAELDDDRFRCDIGFLLDDYAKTDTSVDTYDIDYFQEVIYNISHVGGKMFCRIDYTADKKLTAKLMDYDRASSKVFASCEIKNSGTIPVKSSSDSSAYAYILEKYYQNYASDEDDKYLSIKDYTYQKYVKRQYRIFQKYTDKTYLILQADAITRAANLALIMKDTPKVATVDLPDVDIGLYDVITITLQPNNLDSSAREYAGEHDCLVIGIAPDFDTGINEVTIEIIPDRTASVSQVAVLNSSYTTVSRTKSATQIITDSLQNQITDNLLLTGYLNPQAINVASDSSGIVSDYSKATGIFNVTYNGVDVTGAGPVYSVVTQSDCVGTVDETTGVYAITQLNADTGVLTLRATYQGKSIESSFVVTKSYAGVDGSSEQISIQCSSELFVINSDNSRTPETITFSSVLSTGTTQSAYAGRFKVYADSTLVYTSTSDESSYTYTIPADVKQISAYLFAAGGTTTQKDVCVVPSVSEGTAIEIFMNNNGQGYQTDSDGVLTADYTVTGEVFAYRGTQKVGCKIGTLPTVAGFELSKANNIITFKALAGSSMAYNGKITIPVYLLDSNTAVVIGDAATPYVIGDPATPYVIGTIDADTSRTYEVYFDYWKTPAGADGTDGTDGTDGYVYSITTDNTVFSRARSNVITPATITISAKLSVGTASPAAYAGRFIIYTTADGTTYTSDYTSSANESSKTYTIPTTGVAGIKIELYAAGGTTTLLTSQAISIPYAASVAPEYLGIGIIADVAGLTTKTYTSASITDAGVITAGSSSDAVIVGDWVINYTAGTYRALGIYYWSGTAWSLTSDSKYASDGVIEDICRLNNGGILIPDWTVYVNLITDNLFANKIKLTEKTIGGTTYSGVIYGGDRFNADGTIADRSKNGFYFKTDGKGWCNLQSDDLYNTIIGTDAGLALTVGTGDQGKYNTLLGYGAGKSITNGYSNVLLGANAGRAIISGVGIIAIGTRSGYKVTAEGNSLIGHYSGYNMTTGYNNTIFGFYSGYYITTGSFNTLLGEHAGPNITSGGNNVFIGSYSGGASTGNYNVAIGSNSSVKSATWSYQMNLNSRIVYLEFASTSTQSTVYQAISNYINPDYIPGTRHVGAMGFYNYGTEGDIHVIRYGVDNNITFFNHANAAVLTCSTEISTAIGYALQICFIVPATPTNT